ncbi:EcsC family protein [Commensalibacter sp. ESL0382]|uniref:EcsC family protein n=1 Tax=unclassified Commensalibacter TaxID=2630218 RepID=UPI0012D91702|nr:EcsC family protein [Commensalibacter sp. ESL0382]MUG34974.1 hypothetical protein [Commensalibacter sp. ESL0382]
MNTENNQTIVPYSLNDQEVQDLTVALEQLEAGRGVLLRLADIMGGAVGQAIKLGERGLSLSPRIQKKIEKFTNVSIQRAFEIAILGLNRKTEKKDSNLSKAVWRDRMMKAMVVTSGAVGGFTGLGGMLPDISLTTLALMREIAHVAQEEGENLQNEDTKRACLEVFALRSFANLGIDKDNQLGFFSARLMLRGRPMILLMADVSHQYGLSLSQKLSMQMMPVVSALCGASLNMAFLNHYRSLARLHFVIRRLEREHGMLARETIEYICKNHINSDNFF